MDEIKKIQGFSKLSKLDKLNWLAKHYLTAEEVEVLASFWHEDVDLQDTLDGFSENTVSNFVLPFGIAPNFLIDGKLYAVPMAIEESSVVAAASAGAKFWMDRGGFTTTILASEKVGQLHFKWQGNFSYLINNQEKIAQYLKSEVSSITSKMEARGGGITKIEFLNFSQEMPNLYQMKVGFETCDSMGANFINSILEQFGESFQTYFYTNTDLPHESWRELEIVMAILSNNTPNCVVRAEVGCDIADLGIYGDGMDSIRFAEKFYTAVRIAEIDPYRATTHNKGIYNGVDAVVIATGNDFRATEAAGHSYACRDGKYSSLSHCNIDEGKFRFWMDIPLALGTVGGLTSLHPLAKISLSLLGNPNAKELMAIIASTGLAQNFAAIRSLVTTGIQKGHMKMHLQNILKTMNATIEEKEKIDAFFIDKTVSYTAVRAKLDEIRNT